MCESLADCKTVAEIIEIAITSIAILVGGVWTYFLFVRNRLNYPRVEFDIDVQVVDVYDSKRLVHAGVKIKNVSKVILSSSKAEIRLRQVVPLPENILESAKGGYDPVLPEETEILWPMLAGREWTWSRGEFEIEPDENDILHSDFIIDKSVEVVEFYFFIDNARKSDLGWPYTKICKLP